MARCKGSVRISIVQDGCYTSHPSAKKLPKSVPPQQRTGMGGREPHVRDAEPQQQQVREVGRTRDRRQGRGMFSWWRGRGGGMRGRKSLCEIDLVYILLSSKFIFMNISYVQ